MNGLTNGLNYIHPFVVSSSYAALPTFAVEDTLGLITSTAVTGVYFDNTRPAGRPTGEVRVKTGSLSNNSILIAKNPLASVYPISVYQYNGSSWVIIESYVMKSSVWKRVRCEFYNAGTSALVGTATGYRYNTGSTTVTLGASSFTISLNNASPTGNFVCVYWDTPFDITNIDALKINYTRTWSDQTGTHSAYIYLSPFIYTGINANAPTSIASVALTVAGTSASIDTSALKGNHFLHVSLGRSSYTTYDYLVGTLVYGE